VAHTAPRHPRKRDNNVAHTAPRHPWERGTTWHILLSDTLGDGAQRGMYCSQTPIGVLTTWYMLPPPGPESLFPWLTFINEARTNGVLHGTLTTLMTERSPGSLSRRQSDTDVNSVKTLINVARRINTLQGQGSWPPNLAASDILDRKVIYKRDGMLTFLTTRF